MGQTAPEKAPLDDSASRLSENRVAELLDLWQESYDSGEPLDVEHLCRDCPELVETLATRIEKLRATSWLDEPPEAMTATWEGSGHRRLAAGPPPPSTLGRYRLESPIGKGGFGEVWRGFDIVLTRIVAVKVARTDRFGRPEAADKFLNEARRVAKLKTHAHIVQIHDYGRDGDFCYIVSDYIDGGDLARRLETEGPLEPEQAARLVIAACDALQHAHEHQFVHLDIKPANILVDGKGRPFITDFGVAATHEELANQPEKAGGTIYYMSPEQLISAGKRLDQRSDVYSLGVVLAEALSGRRLFEGISPEAVRAKILRGNPPLTGQNGAPLPPELEAILRKALDRDPARRFGTAAEMAAALRRFVGEAPAPAPWWDWRSLLVAAGLALLLVLAVLGIEAFQRYRAAESVRQTWGSPQAQRLVAEIVLRNFGTLKIEGIEGAIFELSELPPGAFAITDISLRDTQITDELLTYFAEVPSIRTLNLAFTPITDDGLRHLSKIVQLRELRLNGTAVTDAGLVHLTTLPALQHLEVDETDVTDKGMETLAGIASLRRITCTKTTVSDTGMAHLARLPKLKQLRISGTLVTDKGAAAIQAAHPECEVIP